MRSSSRVYILLAACSVLQAVAAYQSMASGALTASAILRIRAGQRRARMARRRELRPRMSADARAEKARTRDAAYVRC